MLVLAWVLGCAVGSGDHLYDVDGDGYVNAEVEGDDCDDANALVHPGAQEICADGIDNNCDGAVDDAGAGADEWFVDADGDGHGIGEAVLACTKPEGMALLGDDCDDSDGSVRPSAEEVCNDGIDNDCDGGPGECLLTGEVDSLSLVSTTINDRRLSTQQVLILDSNGNGTPDLVVPSASVDEFRLHRGPFGVTVGSTDTIVRFTGLDEPFLWLSPDLNGDSIRDLVALGRTSTGGRSVVGFESTFLFGGDGSDPDFELISGVPEDAMITAAFHEVDGINNLWIGQSNQPLLRYAVDGATGTSWEDGVIVPVPIEAETVGASLVELSNGALLTALDEDVWAVFPANSDQAAQGLLRVEVSTVSHGPKIIDYLGQDSLLIGLPNRSAMEDGLPSAEAGQVVVLEIPDAVDVTLEEAKVRITGEIPGFGFAAIPLDFNGDGVDDIAVTEANIENNTTRILLYYGPFSSAELLVNDADLVISDGQESAFFGFWLYSGDMNGDGADDLLVDTLADGRVYIINGSGL